MFYWLTMIQIIILHLLILSSLMCIQAAQILVRSESEGPWLKEILEEVHKGADRLFKMIGEAYSVLSDPTKVHFLVSYADKPLSVIHMFPMNTY